VERSYLPVAAMVLVALGAACRAPRPVVTVNGLQMYERDWTQTTREVGSIASLEMSCPRDELAFELIRKQGRTAVEVGVAGCGHSAIYSRVLRRHLGRTTTANSQWAASIVR
jgi:hypothetical protein